LICGRSQLARKSSAITIATDLLHEVMPQRIGQLPGSSEGLIESVGERPHQVLVYSEFGNLLANAQKDYMTAFKTLINDLADCAPVGRRLSKKSNSTATVDPRVSMLCGVNPTYLEKYSRVEDWTGGFYGRFFFIWAERERHFPRPPVDHQQHDDVLAELRLRGEITQVGRGCGFDEEANRAWNEWTELLESLPHHVSDDTASLIARSTTITLRIAMLLSLDYDQAIASREKLNDWYLTRYTLWPAIEITRMHLISLLSLASTLAPSTDMDNRRKVLACVPYGVDVPIAEIISKSKMLQSKIMPILSSLICENKIQSAGGGGEYYRRIGDDVGDANTALKLIREFSV
jgi:hypothetical protein